MRISYQWLVELLGADPGVEAAARALTLGGLEVEEAVPVGGLLRGVCVAVVRASRPHPSSRQPLTLVTVDPGDGSALEVVCGAPNVPPAGGRVALARVGATVLGRDGAPFTLEARPVAGVQSHGMLCAEDELGLGTDHDGILVLDEGAPGDSVASLPGAADTLLEVNVTPNRGDALSHLGVARDLAALLGLRRPPEDARALPPVGPVDVQVLDPARCPRYLGLRLEGATVRRSPRWLRTRLHRLGVRPLSNVVDVTNYVMLERGQPLHAFDLARLEGARLEVRRAREGEQLKTLEGLTRALSTEDLVIADGEGAVALAGVLGGERSGVSEGTTALLLECAAFDPAGVRRTARRLGVHTESSHRFERGTDARAIAANALRAAELLGALTGAAITGARDLWPGEAPRRSVPLRFASVGALLGVEVPPEESRRALEALGCAVTEVDDARCEVQVPGWRNDLSRPVDLIEEVGRVRGFDTLPGTLPPTRPARAGSRGDYHHRKRLRAALCALGLDEAVHYAFVAPRELLALGLDPGAALRLTNPLSEDRSVLRPSLLPRLVAGIGQAQRYGEDEARLFELGSVFARPLGDDGLPQERTRVALVLGGPRDAWLARPQGVDLYDMKGLVEELVLQTAGVPAGFDRDGEAPPWAHPRAFARVTVGEREAGHLGALHPDALERAGLRGPVVLAELLAEALTERGAATAARSPSRQPAVRRDVCLALAEDTAVGAVLDTLKSVAGPLCERVTLVDRFVGGDLPEGHHALTFGLTFRASDRSLQDDEVDRLREAAVREARTRHGAVQR
ncbi:MAG: phenylalanine--tRNA ligase subunit beta [Deltaproteobacteria bacterium]|nr:phenylalanine--tRNA ligase subunit beta [Deltaproteobacteria bacterium]